MSETESNQAEQPGTEGDEESLRGDSSKEGGVADLSELEKIKKELELEKVKAAQELEGGDEDEDEDEEDESGGDGGDGSGFDGLNDFEPGWQHRLT